jgi:integrase
MTIKHLQARGGALRYRRKIPERLRPYFGGRTEIVQSLGLNVGQEARAIAMVQALDAQWGERLLEAERAYRDGRDPHALATMAEEWALRQKFIGPDTSGLHHGPYEVSDYDHWLRNAITPYERRLGREPELHELDEEVRTKIETVKRGARVPAALTLGRVIDERKKHHWGDKEDKAEAATLPRLEEWIAAHPVLSKQARGGPRSLPLAEINRAAAREFIDYLHTGLGNGAETIRRRLGVLRAIWNWAADHFEDETLRSKNPWARQTPPKVAREAEKVASQKRLPFTEGHLKLIDAYLLRNDIDPHMRAYLRILKYTGARPLEIGGLMKSDVILDAPTPYLHIQVNALRGLKTKGSERRVPIMPEIMGEVSALVDNAALPSTPLFPKGFHNTTTLSNRGNKAIRAAGVPKERRLVVYSFRHTVNQAMLVSGAQPYLRHALLGHTEDSTNAVYGAGSVDLRELKKTMHAAFERLGEAPDYIYTPEEWV